MWIVWYGMSWHGIGEGGRLIRTVVDRHPKSKRATRTRPGRASENDRAVPLFVFEVQTNASQLNCAVFKAKFENMNVP